LKPYFGQKETVLRALAVKIEQASVTERRAWWRRGGYRQMSVGNDRRNVP